MEPKEAFQVWSKCKAFAKVQLVSCFEVLNFGMFINHGLISWHGAHDLMCHLEEIKGHESFTYKNYSKEYEYEQTHVQILNICPTLGNQALD